MLANEPTSTFDDAYAEPLTGRRHADHFKRGIDALEDRFTRIWHEVPAEPPELGKPIRRRLKWLKYRRAKRLIDSLSKQIEAWPDSEDERQSWRQDIKIRIQLFGEECLGWPESYRKLVFGEDFYHSTVAFARRARAFDRHIVPDDLAQALRNVWIMNSLQMLLDLEVGISPSIFAYSMLYPYTDNYLDDPDVEISAKKAFNRHLGRRLAGDQPSGQAFDVRLQDVFRLVAMIEDDHARERHPQVYSSLAAIHDAQIESLRQQRWDRRPSRDDLLGLSIRKGGTSVLTDGYLVAPDLGPEEAEFCFGYGVLLQILDDLQDVEADRQAGHATLFSVAAGDQPLDELAGRLFHFIHRTLAVSSRFSGSLYTDRKDLILRNCTLLLVSAVADNHRFFSRPFLRQLAAGWPLTFAAMRKLRKFSSRKQKKATRNLERRKNVGSLLELLG